MVSLILFLVVLGLVWWLLGYLPLPEPFPTLIKVVIILFVIWRLLAVAGVALPL